MIKKTINEGIRAAFYGGLCLFAASCATVPQQKLEDVVSSSIGVEEVIQKRDGPTWATISGRFLAERKSSKSLPVFLEVGLFDDGVDLPGEIKNFLPSEEIPAITKHVWTELVPQPDRQNLKESFQHAISQDELLRSQELSASLSAPRSLPQPDQSSITLLEKTSQLPLSKTIHGTYYVINPEELAKMQDSLLIFGSGIDLAQGQYFEFLRTVPRPESVLRRAFKEFRSKPDSPPSLYAYVPADRLNVSARRIHKDFWSFLVDLEEQKNQGNLPDFRTLFTGILNPPKFKAELINKQQDVLLAPLVTLQQLGQDQSYKTVLFYWPETAPPGTSLYNASVKIRDLFRSCKYWFTDPDNSELVTWGQGDLLFEQNLHQYGAKKYSDLRKTLRYRYAHATPLDPVEVIDWYQEYLQNLEEESPGLFTRFWNNNQPPLKHEQETSGKVHDLFEESHRHRSLKLFFIFKDVCYIQPLQIGDHSYVMIHSDDDALEDAVRDLRKQTEAKIRYISLNQTVGKKGRRGFVFKNMLFPEDLRLITAYEVNGAWINPLYEDITASEGMKAGTRAIGDIFRSLSSFLEDKVGNLY